MTCYIQWHECGGIPTPEYFYEPEDLEETYSFDDVPYLGEPQEF